MSRLFDFERLVELCHERLLSKVSVRTISANLLRISSNRSIPQTVSAESREASEIRQTMPVETLSPSPMSEAPSLLKLSEQFLKEGTCSNREGPPGDRKRREGHP